MLTQEILRIICTHFNVTYSQLTNREGIRATLEIVSAKQTAAYFLWRRTRLTREQIANILCYGSKNAAIMADKKIREIIVGDKALREKVETIEKQLIRE